MSQQLDNVRLVMLIDGTCQLSEGECIAAAGTLVASVLVPDAPNVLKRLVNVFTAHFTPVGHPRYFKGDWLAMQRWFLLAALSPTPDQVSSVRRWMNGMGPFTRGAPDNYVKYLKSTHPATSIDPVMFNIIVEDILRSV